MANPNYFRIVRQNKKDIPRFKDMMTLILLVPEENDEPVQKEFYRKR